MCMQQGAGGAATATTRASSSSSSSNGAAAVGQQQGNPTSVKRTSVSDSAKALVDGEKKIIGGSLVPDAKVRPMRLMIMSE